MEFCKDKKISNMEKLRLVTLYALRYEKDIKNIEKLKDELSNNSLNDDMISLIDLLLLYAGKS